MIPGLVIFLAAVLSLIAKAHLTLPAAVIAVAAVTVACLLLAALAAMALGWLLESAPHYRPEWSTS
jgi:hypothetical protein